MALVISCFCLGPFIRPPLVCLWLFHSFELASLSRSFPGLGLIERPSLSLPRLPTTYQVRPFNAAVQDTHTHTHSAISS